MFGISNNWESGVNAMTSPEDYRKQMLLNLYNQLWSSINARLNLIWESVSILVGAFAIFALTEKNIIDLDLATALIVVMSGWFLAHVVDMSFWFNRNLVVIANIERQFLNPQDGTLIYGYFLTHRPRNRMVHYYRIQAVLGIGISVLVLLMHFNTRIVPLLGSAAVGLTLQNFIPYMMLIIVVIWLLLLKRGRDAEYATFVAASPGKDMTPDIQQSGLQGAKTAADHSA
jgi:hypothetical protein